MTDIKFDNQDRDIVMWKRLWNETELILARCYNFTVDIDRSEVRAQLHVTDKRAIYHFIQNSFRNFSEALEEHARRDAFYKKLEVIYQFYDSHAQAEMQALIPHYNILYTHQKEIISRSFFRQHNFIAADPGTGKTNSAASYALTMKSQRVFIGCPAVAKWNWFKDLKKFGFNELEFTILDSRKKYTMMAFIERYIVCNYDITDKFYDHLLSSPIDLFILDEAHLLKSKNSARSKKIEKLIFSNPKAKIMFLSGTPIKNRVDDVFNYMHLTGNEMGKNHKKFLDAYTLRANGRGGERVVGGKNLQDLHNKLLNFMIRIRKEECLDLPPKVYLRYTFELDDYKTEYDAVLAEMAKEKNIQTILSNIHTLNILTSKAKKAGIIELAESIIEGDRKVVIFGGYKEPLNDLAEYFGDRCVKIDGSVNSFDRSSLVDKFNNDPSCQVFLGNYTAAGTAINLVSASDIIIQSFPLTPAELEQGIDRLHRIGQVKSVNVHYTFCEDSVDEHLHDLLNDKLADINAVIDASNEVVEREDIKEILIKKLLKRDDVELNYFARSDKQTESTSEQQVLQQTTEPVLRENDESVSDSNRNVIEVPSGGNDGQKQGLRGNSSIEAAEEGGSDGFSEQRGGRSEGNKESERGVAGKDIEQQKTSGDVNGADKNLNKQSITFNSGANGEAEGSGLEAPTFNLPSVPHFRSISVDDTTGSGEGEDDNAGIYQQASGEGNVIINPPTFRSREEGVVEVSQTVLVKHPWLAPNDESKPQYYLVLDFSISQLSIVNEGENFDDVNSLDRQMLFQHHEPKAVVMYGRHWNMTKNYDFDESFVLNEEQKPLIPAPPLFRSLNG